MKKKRIILAIMIVTAFQLVQAPGVFAAKFSESNATRGEITGKSVVSGLCSFLIWPGIGQYVNDCETKKNVTHALLGITQIFRFWSGWDALVQRKGGYWDGKI